ncbi:MAG TPA: efflux RND transporter periplasmic adaptor subunit [Blastocatellia bacterium]|nr:efflux RND transporter periplasmic adaptor subunit [Blastocatellia bacterium]
MRQRAITRRGRIIERQHRREITRRGPRWYVLVAFTPLLVLPVGCKSGTSTSGSLSPASAHVQEPKRVRTVPVSERTVERIVVAMGTLAAYDQATLRVKVPGRLQAITVDLGSVVHQGHLIAQIEPQDYQIRVQQAEAALAQARVRLGLPPEGTDDRVDPEQTATVRQARALLEEARATRDRSLQLYEEGIISRAKLDTDEAAYKVALSRYQDALEEVRNRQAVLLERRAQLMLARQQLSDTSIIAPFDGMIQERHTSVGEFLAAGAPVVTLVRVDPLRLRADVPERDARAVRAGQLVRVTIEGDATIYTGRIVRLSPTITAQNRMLMVEAEVRNNGRLRPGAFARVEIVTDDRSKALTIPTSAIVTFAGIEKVILVRDGKAVERPITTGRRTSEWVEVVSGLTPEDRVVVDPGNLQSGQPVTVIE